MRKKTHEEFLSDIADRPFNPIDPYNGNKIPIRFVCDDCGGEWKATPTNILFGGTGCPLCFAVNRSANEILSNEHGVLRVDVSTKTHKNAVMMILSSDYHRIKKLGCGRIAGKSGGNDHTIYAQTILDGKNAFIHSLVLDSAKMVDHRDHNGLNNTRENLRECTPMQNQRNRRKSTCNKTGHIGVSKHKATGKFVAQITINGKRTHLGLFSDIDEAVSAHRKAVDKHYGEFAYNG